MKNKSWLRVIATILTVLPCLFGGMAVAEPASEATAMFYWQMPLDGKQRGDKRSLLGFRIDNAQHDTQQGIDLPRLFQKPALMDFHLGKSGLAAWKVLGIDVLEPKGVYRADDAETAAGTEAATMEAAEGADTPAGAEAAATDTAAEGAETAAEVNWGNVIPWALVGAVVIANTAGD